MLTLTAASTSKGDIPGFLTVTVTVAVPSETPVTSPASLTTAISGFLLLYSKVASDKSSFFPSLKYPLTVSIQDSLIFRSSFSGVAETPSGTSFSPPDSVSS